MSITLYVRTITDSDISEVKNNPLKLIVLFHGGSIDKDMIDDLEEDYDTEWTAKEKKTLLTWKPQISSESFSVDYFNKIHFLLSGETDTTKNGNFPNNFLLHPKLGMGNIGYGQGSFYTSNDVKAIDTFLNSVSEKKLIEKLNNFQSQKDVFVYSEWDDASKKELSESFISLKKDISEIAQKGYGIYIVLI